MTTELSRRNFLKSVGIMAGGIALCPFKILLPFEKPIAEEQKLFMVRKLCLSNPDEDEWLIRYDVMFKKGNYRYQYYAAIFLSEEILSTISTEEFKKSYHKFMTEQLGQQLRRDKVQFKHLYPPPIPANYYEPKYFTTLINGRK